MWPQASLPDGPTWMASAFHVGAYVVFGVAVQWAVPELRWGWVVVVGLTAGLANEYAQLWLTNDRAFEVADIVADGVGVLLSLGLWRSRPSVV